MRRQSRRVAATYTLPLFCSASKTGLVFRRRPYIWCHNSGWSLGDLLLGMGRRQGCECHNPVCTTSVLNGDKVVSPLKSGFPLETFPDFILCYILLCRIADHVAEKVNGVFEKWKSD